MQPALFQYSLNENYNYFSLNTIVIGLVNFGHSSRSNSSTVSEVANFGSFLFVYDHMTVPAIAILSTREKRVMLP